MSYNYLETPFWDIPELAKSVIRINDKFKNFHLLENYKHIMIIEWNRDYPLEIPNGVIALTISCEYAFPLNNLPSSLEILDFAHSFLEKIRYPLENLPNNLYHLEFNSHYTYPLDCLPESIKILRFNAYYMHSFNNSPIGLKELKISNCGFGTDEIMSWPPTLESLDISRCNAERRDNIEQFQHKINLIELPITLRKLHLPTTPISNLEAVLSRLINLEELHVEYVYLKNMILFPPNLKRFYMKSTRVFFDYPDELLITPNLMYLEINEWFDGSINLANSNLEHLKLYFNDTYSIVNQIPKSLKKLEISYNHPEVAEIKQRYPQLDILILGHKYQEYDDDLDNE